MEWLPPTLTASTCAKVVVLKPREEEDEEMKNMKIEVDQAKSISYIALVIPSEEIFLDTSLNRIDL